MITAVGTLARTRDELAAALGTGPGDAPGEAPGEAGTHRRRAVVMTMGALHAGHLSLVRQAKELADQVVVTIFVNPLQFGAGEDLSRYPRDLAGDLALLTGPGLLDDGDVVFAPTPDVMYPDGDPLVRVSAGAIGSVLEGASRPGHLDGVLTVVLKLLHLTRPDVAIFGRKDAQQLAAVRRMVRDLDVPVEVVGAPLVREPDGLAMSSRNAYLTPDERVRALALSTALATGVAAATAGSSADVVRTATLAALVGGLAGGSPDGTAGADPQRTAPDEVDYVALVRPDDFRPVAADHTGEALLLLAARVGGTRLIDNTTVTLGGPA
ncbi:pantoate--beta-alanine ligase [Cellulomonas sp. DKR-3]|uniref:Pantothenate synthetase n=1 Tax=Cellulomonas fulva TaxID=2835530 RepID=A0ABS5TVS3_9CELL|nr:pantoate--beta-alanine ligase [Cellulomonas fulva]MBT0993202.1 pantoate--beta-alanine ligase [Cellulomonas fulva]